MGGLARGICRALGLFKVGESQPHACRGLFKLVERLFESGLFHHASPPDFSSTTDFATAFGAARFPAVRGAAFFGAPSRPGVAVVLAAFAAPEATAAAVAAQFG